LSKQRQKIWERKFALKYTDVNIERVQLSLNLSMQRNKDFFENWFSRSTSSDSWSNNLRRKNLIFYSCRSTNLEFVLKGTAQTFYTKFWKPNHWFNEKYKKVWIRPNAIWQPSWTFRYSRFFIQTFVVNTQETFLFQKNFSIVSSEWTCTKMVGGKRLSFMKINWSVFSVCMVFGVDKNNMSHIEMWYIFRIEH
jgi:hypothetical protein